MQIQIDKIEIIQIKTSPATFSHHHEDFVLLQGLSCFPTDSDLNSALLFLALFLANPQQFSVQPLADLLRQLVPFSVPWKNMEMTRHKSISIFYQN